MVHIYYSVYIYYAFYLIYQCHIWINYNINNNLIDKKAHNKVLNLYEITIRVKMKNIL